MDIGLLIVRMVVGLLFVGHGTQKLFGWFGGRGLGPTGGMFASLGYRPQPHMAVLAGLTEAGGGALLAVGLLTPFAAAGIIGAMVNATVAVHLPKGVWNSNGGYELPLVYATVAATVAFTGPGATSLDNAIGLGWAGVVWGMVAIGLGIGTGSVVLVTRRTPAQVERDRSQDQERAA